MPSGGSSVWLPERLLDVELWPGAVGARYLTTRDTVWVESALDIVTAGVGLPRATVETRLREQPRLGERRRAWNAMAQLLLGLHGFAVEACAPPARLRAEVFALAARAGPGASRSDVIEEAARRLSVSPVALEEDLYADLPAARLLLPSVRPLSPAGMIERYNLALAQGLLLRAESLEVRLQGQMKAVLRFARLQGLLCMVTTADADATPRLHLSGPLALFHQTLKYGRAMAAWLPVLVRAPRWEAAASCFVGGERRVWRASCHDPLGTTHVPPRRFDSQVEERLFRDLRREAPDWEVLREVDAVQLGRRIVVPDFTLVNQARGLRIPVEVVGFWTPEYLADKLATLRALPTGKRWLVCIDERLAAGSARSLPVGPLLPFRRRIDVQALLRAIDAR